MTELTKQLEEIKDMPVEHQIYLIERGTYINDFIGTSNNEVKKTIIMYGDDSQRKYFMTDEDEEVRGTLVKYGSDENRKALRRDPSDHVKELIVMYGSDEDREMIHEYKKSVDRKKIHVEKVESHLLNLSFHEQVTLIKRGTHLDMFINSTSPIMRTVVAEHGLYCHHKILIKDKESSVKQAAYLKITEHAFTRIGTDKDSASLHDHEITLSFARYSDTYDYKSKEEKTELMDYEPYQLWVMGLYMKLFHEAIQYTKCITEKVRNVSNIHREEYDYYMDNIHHVFPVGYFDCTETVKIERLTTPDAVKEYKLSKEIYDYVIHKVQGYYGYGLIKT